MNEFEFSKHVDCKFPYNDRRTALALIDQANSISSNAMFVVLNELCRVPRGVEVTHSTLSYLMDVWEQRMDHPLSKPVLKAARIMAGGDDLPIAKSLALMEEIAPFRRQYAALSIAYFSCDDVDGVLDTRFNEIRAKWDAEAGRNKSQ